MTEFSSRAQASFNELYKAIGGLTAEVSALRRDIQAADRRGTETSKRAEQHRAVMHRRVDELVAEVGDLKADMAKVVGDVADAKQVTDDVRRWKLMGIGALGVTGIAAGAISSAITFFWSDIVRLLRAG